MKKLLLFIPFFLFGQITDPTPSAEDPTLETVVPPQEDSYKKTQSPSELSDRDVLFEEGKKYMNEENWIKAQGVFEELVQKNDRDLDAKIMLGYALFHQGKYEEAEAYWKKVVSQSPNNKDALLALYTLYLELKEETKAAEFFEKGSSNNEEQAAYHALKHYQYFDAYRSFDQLYAKDRRYDYLNKLVYLRPKLYPFLESKTLYSREKEQDLITRVYTIRFSNWRQNVFFNVPIKGPLNIYGLFNYHLTNQYNLLNGFNNYKVNIFTYGGGVNLNFHDQWIIDGNLQERRGKDTFSDSIFVFRKNKHFEPGVNIRYIDEHQFLNLAGYYDAFVARNFTDIFSYFVKRKSFVPTYEVRLKGPYNVIGVDALLSYYDGTQKNKRRGAGLWLRASPDQMKKYFIFEYRGFYSTFDQVDPDYFSYRKRWEHYFISTFQYLKQAVALFQINYTFSWQKVENFINIAEGIETSVTPPEVIQKNIFKGYQVEVVARKWAKTNFMLETVFKYYIDTNKYETYAGHVLLNYVF